MEIIIVDVIKIIGYSSKHKEPYNMTNNENNESLNESSANHKTIQTVELTHVALGIAKDPNTNKWSLVKVRFNPETKDSGGLEIITNSEGTRDAVSYAFKIAAVDEGIIE